MKIGTPLFLEKITDFLSFIVEKMEDLIQSTIERFGVWGFVVIFIGGILVVMLILKRI